MSSAYYRSLDGLHQARYREKLLFNGELLPDPLDEYLRDSVFDVDAKIYPDVSFGDIYLYLVETKCFYTRESFKSYKMTEGYNFFMSGKVERVLTYCHAACSVFVVTADVEGSQNLKKMHKPWTVIEKTGAVLSAHCTCMAGLGEACSHISALLFTVESCIKEGLNAPACTSIPCTWKKVKREVEPAPISEIDFIKVCYKKRSDIPPKEKNKTYVLPKASDSQLKSFKEDLKHVCPNGVFHLMSTDSETETDTELNDENDSPNHQLDLPLPPNELYKGLSPDEALNVTISTQYIENVEKSIRLQHLSPVWKGQRQGRLTASNFGKISSCKTGQERLVAEVMGYLDNPKSKALSWGKKQELNAKNAFIDVMKRKHNGFVITGCGLIISVDSPFLGATPDGKISFHCGGEALLEIKCPESLKNKSITPENVRPTFYLVKILELKKNHHYYYQVQGQMAISKILETYFVVYTTVTTLITQVAFDALFWCNLKQQLEDFFLNHVLAELQHQRIKKKFENAKENCICKGEKSGGVLTCACCFKIFHLKCVNLKRSPKSWVCCACVAV